MFTLKTYIICIAIMRVAMSKIGVSCEIIYYSSEKIKNITDIFRCHKKIHILHIFLVLNMKDI